MPWQHRLKAILPRLSGRRSRRWKGSWISLQKINPSGPPGWKPTLCGEDTLHSGIILLQNVHQSTGKDLFIGYRYYDTSLVRFQYPFGYGLSYTESLIQPWKADLKNGVQFTVTNVGERTGQRLLSFISDFRIRCIFRPGKELKGFQKVFLKAEKAKQCIFHLMIKLSVTGM